jgi:DNA polymerase epsilon subunit 4
MDETQDIDVEIDKTAEQTQLQDLEHEEDTQDVDEQVDEQEEQDQSRPDSAATGRVKGPTRDRKEQQSLVREPGKSLLPHTRVQKIIKADKVCFIRL